MKKEKYTRREFFKLGALGLGAVFLRPPRLTLNNALFSPSPNPSVKAPRTFLVGSQRGVSVHKLPDDSSLIMYQLGYNDIINVYDQVKGPAGPYWNPIWYRVWGGYVHSGNLYEVKYILNSLNPNIRPTGQLAEITVPYTQSYFYNNIQGWIPVYRLYYGSTHWIMDVITGPDEKPWYKIKDELDSSEIAVPSEHLRFIPDEDFEPISPNVPPGDKHIEISITYQNLKAYEGENLVFETKISTGSITVPGNFHIQTKLPSKHMGIADLSNDIYAYRFVGVPWTCFFQMEDGLATHGVYWHSNFGTPMSAGCINMSIPDAKWVYRWTTPVAAPEDWEKRGYGTAIHITP